MQNIADAIDVLDDDDMERVERLVLKLANRQKEGVKKQRRTVPEKAAKQIKRAGRKKALDNDDSEANINQRNRRKRRGPRSEPQGQRRAKGQRKQKTYASRKSLQTGPRHNKFLDMQESQMHRRDTKEFDEKVNVYQPTPRTGRTSLVEAECKECGYVFDVSPEVVYNDPDIGPVFTCNDCATSRKHSRRD